MNKSESIKALSLALLKAQAAVGVIPKNATNPFYKKEYADLGSHIDKIQPALRENNLVLSQFVSSDDGNVGITNLLVHTTSGEWLEQSVYMNVPETFMDRSGNEKPTNQAQEAGKIISYIRRYSLAGIMNVYSGDDNDAQMSVTKTEGKPATTTKVKATGKEGTPTERPKSTSDHTAYYKFTKNYMERSDAADILKECGGDTQTAFDYVADKYKSLDNKEMSTLGFTTEGQI